jgi:hypothetical protein
MKGHRLAEKSIVEYVLFAIGMMLWPLAFLLLGLEALRSGIAYTRYTTLTGQAAHNQAIFLLITAGLPFAGMISILAVRLWQKNRSGARR